MKIDRDEACRVAALAHLEFDDAGLDRMAAEMTAILDYIDQLREVDVQGFQERDAAVTPFREDQPRLFTASDGSEIRELVERNAPAWRDGHFVVPKVIGGE
jgi:aspartyl-tRNA(Asn)/glutamyl-tRNA(Gln) amidotransferase subunit C